MSTTSSTTSTVTSADGTTLACTTAGSGPAVVLVGGGLDDGSENAVLIPALAEGFTVVNYARRGRGGSGDTPPYALDRELEDLAAVIEAAGGPGGAAHLFGASSGGALALEAAAAGLAVERVAAFELPYSTTPEAIDRWQAYVADLHDALAAADRDRALELFMAVAGLPTVAVTEMKASPYWPHLVGLAHTLAYDAACLHDGTPPVDRFARVTQPVLVLTGVQHDAVMSEADPEFFGRSADAVAAALPNAQRRTVAAAGHAVDAEAVAPALLAFFGG